MTKVRTYLYNAGLLKIIFAPLVWVCIVPAFFLDLVMTVFQFICFPVYNIPKVNRSDYIVLDRHSLKYLNIIEKVNCLYCGYFNGLGSTHSRYSKFLDYGDADSYKKDLERIKQDFEDLDQS